MSLDASHDESSDADYVNRGIDHAKKVLEDFQGYVNSLPEKEIKRIEKNGIELNEQQKNTIEKNLAKKIDIDKIISRIHPVESYNDLSQCGLIIEAVFEKQEIKNDLFKDLSESIGDNTIVASNTSSLSITEMASTVFSDVCSAGTISTSGIVYGGLKKCMISAFSGYL